jgi:hypothetical protein
MKKIILVMLSLVVISMFLIGCTQEEVSDAELEAQLSELSAEELDQTIETVEAEDTGALAGQAFKRISKSPRNVPKDKFLKTAYKVKSLMFIEPPCPTDFYYISKEDPVAHHCEMDKNSDWYACGYDSIPEDACPPGLSLKTIGLGMQMGPNYYEQQYICESYGNPITYEEMECGTGYWVMDKGNNQDLGLYYAGETKCKADLDQECVESLYVDFKASDSTPYSNTDWLNEYSYKKDIECCSNSSKVLYGYHCANVITFNKLVLSPATLDTACKSGHQGSMMENSMGVCCLKE